MGNNQLAGHLRGKFAQRSCSRQPAEQSDDGQTTPAANYSMGSAAAPVGQWQKEADYSECSGKSAVSGNLFDPTDEWVSATEQLPLSQSGSFHHLVHVRWRNVIVFVCSRQVQKSKQKDLVARKPSDFTSDARLPINLRIGGYKENGNNNKNDFHCVTSATSTFYSDICLSVCWPNQRSYDYSSFSSSFDYQSWPPTKTMRIGPVNLAPGFLL